jgi:hypothetical protein
MSTAGIVILIVVVVVALAVAGWLTAQRRALRAKFGPEYDRVVTRQPSRAAGELGEPPVPQSGEPLAVEPPAIGPVGDRAINNSVPTPVPGNAPRRLS